MTRRHVPEPVTKATSGEQSCISKLGFVWDAPHVAVQHVSSILSPRLDSGDVTEANVHLEGGDRALSSSAFQTQ